MIDKQSIASADASLRALSSGSLADYVALLKPRVMSLAIFTAAVGLAVAPGTINPVLAVTALILIAMGAGGAGALNMWYDADIDGLMQRTAKRPLPRGRVARDDALALGVFMSGFSVFSLGLLVNWVSAALLALSIGFYVLIYTSWLKRRTPQNIVIGGAAGALPPMIGWAAATGGMSWESFSLFLIIFFWTPPHFWALALCRARDYRRAGVPMMPNVYGSSHTRAQILLYTCATVLASFLPASFGFVGLFYTVIATSLGASLLVLAWRVFRSVDGYRGDRASRQLFAFSILYLFGLFGAMLGEHGFGFAK